MQSLLLFLIQNVLVAACTFFAYWHGGRAVKIGAIWFGVNMAISVTTALAGLASPVVFLVVDGVFALGLTEKSQALAFQMTLDHLACLRLGHQPVSAEAATVEQQWPTTAGWPLRVAASTDDPPLRLRGVRRCAVIDGRVAHLMYEWQGQPLSVYVLPSDAVRGTANVRRFGHDAAIWADNGRTYVVLARAQLRPEFDRVVRYVKANVH